MGVGFDHYRRDSDFASRVGSLIRFYGNAGRDYCRMVCVDFKLWYCSVGVICGIVDIYGHRNHVYVDRSPGGSGPDGRRPCMRCGGHFVPDVDGSDGWTCNTSNLQGNMQTVHQNEQKWTKRQLNYIK